MNANIMNTQIFYQVWPQRSLKVTKGHFYLFIILVWLNYISMVSLHNLLYFKKLYMYVSFIFNVSIYEDEDNLKTFFKRKKYSTRRKVNFFFLYCFTFPHLNQNMEINFKFWNSEWSVKKRCKSWMPWISAVIWL